MFSLDGLRLRTVRAVAFGVLALGSGLGLAALAAWLIARAWEMPPVLDLSVAVVSVRALGISRGIGRYLERLSTHDVALRSMTAARVGIYRTLADADLTTVSRLRRGDVLTRIGSDVDALGAVVVRAVVPIAVAVVLSVAAVGLLAAISLPAAAIFAVALAVSGILAPVLSARAARDAEQAGRGHRADYTANTVTALDHAAELRVAGRLDAVLAAAHEAGRRAVAAEDRAAAKGALAVAAVPLSIGISVLGALVAAIHSTAMTPMSMAIVVLVPLSAFEAVATLPAAAQALNRARTPELRDAAPAAAAGPGPATIERPDCSRVALVGPSGAGKTTLLMAWAGPSATFFAEDAHLFDTTVLENLRVGRGSLTDVEAVEVLRKVGLGPWLAGLPDGVDTHLVGGAAAVSGGQRRRILLARALVSRAQVLLLDEPTEHLDAAGGAQLLRDLLNIDSGLVSPERTVVVVTHQLPADHAADTVLTLPLPADFRSGKNPLQPLAVAT